MRRTRESWNKVHPGAKVPEGKPGLKRSERASARSSTLGTKVMQLPFLKRFLSGPFSFEFLFGTAAWELELRNNFRDAELETLFVISFTVARCDANLVTYKTKRSPQQAKPNLYYSDYFSDPILQRNDALISAVSSRNQSQSGLPIDYYEACRRVRTALTRAHGPLVTQESSWRSAAALFRNDRCDRAYTVIKRWVNRHKIEGRRVSNRPDRTPLLVGLAGLMLCMVSTHSEFQSLVQRGDCSATRHWGAIDRFVRKYERSSIELFRRYVDEALTYIAVTKPRGSFARFQLFRRLLRIFSCNRFASVEVMQYCLARRSNFALAEKIYPILWRIEDTEEARSEFQKWRRERKSSSKKGNR